MAAAIVVLADRSGVHHTATQERIHESRFANPGSTEKGERAIPDEKARRSISLWLRVGAATMPLGFFLGGILNFEGDPSLGILLVPIGGVCLLYALLRAALIARKPEV